MIFHQVPDNELVSRWESENGRWEIGWAHRTFGRFQLTIGLAGSMFYNVEYCCGDSQDGQNYVWLLVMLVLAKMPEEIREYDLEQIFPPRNLRPVYDDPEFMVKLEAIAYAETLPTVESTKRQRLQAQEDRY